MVFNNRLFFLLNYLKMDLWFAWVILQFFTVVFELKLSTLFN